MITETFELSKDYPGATLTTYINRSTPEFSIDNRDAVIVFPGGGYEFLSDRESEPIALRFAAKGMNAFILRYTVKHTTKEYNAAKDYAPLIEAALAIKHVRENAKKYQINPNRIFVIGFSAGGHLAASAGTLWNIPEVRAALGDAPVGINRPDGMILCYPVISGVDHPHIDSFKALIDSDEPCEADLLRFSIEKHVDSTTSPAFIWHTAEDTCVPVENSLAMARALSEKNVPFELHIFPFGGHGLSLADESAGKDGDGFVESHAKCWSDLAIRWIKMLKKR